MPARDCCEIQLWGVISGRPKASRNMGLSPAEAGTITTFFGQDDGATGALDLTSAKSCHARVVGSGMFFGAGTLHVGGPCRGVGLLHRSKKHRYSRADITPARSDPTCSFYRRDIGVDVEDSDLTGSGEEVIDPACRRRCAGTVRRQQPRALLCGRE
jgi:hypothetical protein